MKTRQLIEHLVATLDDKRLSRSERRALHAVMDEHPVDTQALLEIQAAVFDAAAEDMHDPRDREVLRWVESCLAALRAHDKPKATDHHPRAWFGPDDPLASLLASQLEAARRSIDAAVFTITDDSITETLITAHKRGIAVRIISDDDKAGDRGSDIWRLQRAGIAVRTDHAPTWMHHKFAVIDGATLLNGSYNWTRAGARDNHENFLATADPTLVRHYADAFERLWAEFDTNA